MEATFAAATRVNSVEVGGGPPGGESCSTILECGTSDPLWIVVLLASATLLAPVALLTISRVREAVERVEREREKTARERGAFETFARRVASLDGESPTAPGGASGHTPGAVSIPRSGLATSGSAAASGDTLEDVVEAYRETILSLSHHDEDYGHSARADMRMEFGDSVWELVEASDALTPQVQAGIVQRSRQAAALRADFADALDREADALASAETELGEVVRVVEDVDPRPLSEKSFEELFGAHERLVDLESRVETHLRDRQRAIHDDPFNRSREVPGGDPPLQWYLYEDFDVTYPVLADGVEVVDRIRTAAGRVESSIATRA